MVMNQKSMAENELKIRQLARDRVRKRRANRLPIVNGYNTSVRKETGDIVFSSVTDGWCFEYDVESVKRLLANGDLKQDLNRKHNACINDRNKYI